MLITIFEFMLLIALWICDEYCGLLMMTGYNHRTKTRGVLRVYLYINLELSEQGYFHATHFESCWDGGAYCDSRSFLQQSSSH